MTARLRHTACHLLTYILSREPEQAMLCCMLIDRLHSNNHTSCAAAHNLYTYESPQNHLHAGHAERLAPLASALWQTGDATDDSQLVDLVQLLLNTQAAEQFHRCAKHRRWQYKVLLQYYPKNPYMLNAREVLLQL
jgi:hypothetical protein